MIMKNPTLSTFLKILGIGFICLAVAACIGPPDWVEKGTAVLNEEKDKTIYGVGAVTGVKNEPLAWETAENRARAELAKTFRTYTAYLMRDYAASTTCSTTL